MKKVLLIIGLLLIVVLVNSYNYPNTWSGNRSWAYENKTLEIMYDSKKRPHKIVIYSKFRFTNNSGTEYFIIYRLYIFLKNHIE